MTLEGAILDEIRKIQENSVPLPKKIRMTEDEARTIFHDHNQDDPGDVVLTSLYSVPVEIVHAGTLAHYGRWEY